MLVYEDVPNYLELKEKIPKVKGFFWDMDGTLMNSEHIHSQAIELVLHQVGINNPPSAIELEEQFTGWTDIQVLEALQETHKTEETIEELLQIKNQITCDLVGKHNVKSLINDDVFKLLNDIVKSNIPMALVTSSEKSVVNKILDEFDLRKYFKVIFTREDTSQNKPHPAPYLTAMKALNVTPEESCIFEDSKGGLTAATASKANVVQVKWYSK